MTKETQTSEKVLLDARHVIENLQTEEGLNLVRSKALQTLTDRVKSRLTPALVALYSAGYDPSSATETPGMKTLQSLRSVERSLAAVAPLVAALSNEKTSGRELWTAACQAKSDTFTACPKLIEIALQRDLDRASKNPGQDFSEMLDLLGVIVAPPASGGEQAFNVNLLETAEKRLAFQEREILRLLAELMRADDKIEDVTKLAKAILSAEVLPETSPVLIELKALAKILQPMDSSISTQELDVLVNRFRTDQSMRFHKVLCNFATGLQALEQAAKAVVQRLKNDGLKSRLETLLREVVSLPVVPSAAEIALGHLEDHVSAYKPHFVELAALKGESKDDFLENNKATFEKITGKIQDMVSQVACPMLYCTP